MQMFKRVAAALFLAVLICFSTFSIALADPNTDGIVIKLGEQDDNVILLQMRLQDLGYYDYKVTGFFGTFTQTALKDFQKTNGLPTDGVAGSGTIQKMYSNGAKRSAVEEVNPAPAKATTSKSKIKGTIVKWKTVDSVWRIGMKCKVIDVDTNKSYYMIRVNESYSVGHSDVAPPDKSNNRIFESTYGKYYPSWYRRAVIVNIPGLGWVAASTNGYPHGGTGIKGNGMTDPTDGSIAQVCIHFLGSWDNCSGIVDPAHQYQIYHAAGKKYSGARSSLVYPGD
jgi:peptidoglycan hydrolase-like protein with peptidoglycan-binding domain